jgi:hypothetical protein
MWTLDVRVTYKPRAARTATAAVRDVLSEYAQLIEDRAKAWAPVETGELRDSIYVEVIDGGVRLHAGEGLPDGRAKFQEYGFHHYQTGKWIQNPYARPALESYKRQFRAALKQALMSPL